MRTTTLFALITLAGCRGVDGDVFRGASESGGAPSDARDVTADIGAPPPRDELVWWHGLPGGDVASAGTSTANAAVAVSSDNAILGLFERDVNGGIAENGELNAGSFSRTNPAHGEGEATLLDVATAGDDSLWISGSLVGRTDFGGADISVGDAHVAYVVRYPVQLNGSAEVRTFAAAEASATALAASGTTIYAAITYEGSLSTGLSNVPAEGPGDGALLALDGDGTTLWAARIGGPGHDEALAVAALTDGAVVVGHAESGLRPGGPSGGFVRRYDAAGVMLWEHVVPDATLESVAVHADGAITVAGTALGAAFVAHHATDGTQVWSSPLSLRTGGARVIVAVDASDRIVVGGQTQGPPGEDTPGGFLELLDRTGAPTRLRIYPGAAALRDVVPAGDDLLVIGDFASLDLGAGPLPNPAGGRRGFIARLRVSAD